jgi:hypothetical protein
VAYTEAKEAWSNERISDRAASILESQLDEERRPLFIVNTILDGSLRPLFSATSFRTLTPSGRPALYGQPSVGGGKHLSSDDIIGWRARQPYALTILQWAVTASSVSNTNSPNYMHLRGEGEFLDLS